VLKGNHENAMSICHHGSLQKTYYITLHYTPSIFSHSQKDRSNRRRRPQERGVEFGKEAKTEKPTSRKVISLSSM